MLRVLIFLTAAICLSSAQEPEYRITTVNLTAQALAAPDTRIVGGTNTAITSYPYAVQLTQAGQLSCGGSLITARHVLSAAHCVVDSNTGVIFSPQAVMVRAGTTNLNSGGITRALSAIIVHEQFNRITLDADVAVLLMASAVTLSASVQPAALPVMAGMLPVNTALVHVGWGRIAESGPVSNVLLEVTVYKVNHTLCTQRYMYLTQLLNVPFIVTNNMICAGILGVGGADACQGDSGGPLVLANNRNVLVGITSWGFGCGNPEYPGVSARMASYTSWVNETVSRYNSAPSLTLTSTALLLAALFASLTLVKDV